MPVEYSNETLTAFLDNELDSETAQEISNQISDDSRLRQRVSELAIDKDLVRASFDSLLTDVLPAHADISFLENKAQPKFGFKSYAAIAAGIAAMAMVIFNTILNRSNHSWPDQIVMYQTLYSKQTLAQIETSRQEKLAQLEKLGNSINLDLGPYEALPHLSFVRAQSLQFDGRTLAHLSYVSATGEPIALCILADEIISDEDGTWQTVQGLDTLTWTEGDYSYFLVGRLSEKEKEGIEDMFL